MLFHLSRLVFSLQIVILYFVELLYHKQVSQLIGLEYLSPILVFSALGFFASGLILMYRLVSWTCMKRTDELASDIPKDSSTTNKLDPCLPDKLAHQNFKSSSHSFALKQPFRSSSGQAEFPSVKRDSKSLIKSVSSGNVVDSELKPELLSTNKEEKLQQVSLNMDHPSKPIISSPRLARPSTESPKIKDGTAQPEHEQRFPASKLPFWKHPKKLGFLYCHTYVLSASVIVFMGIFGYIQLANKESTVVWKVSVFCALVHSTVFLISGLLLSSQIKEYLLTKSYSWSQPTSKVSGGSTNRAGRLGHSQHHPRLKSELGGRSFDADNSINPIIEEGDQMAGGSERPPEFHPLNMNSAELDGSQQYRRQVSQAGDEMNPDTPRSIISSIKSLRSGPEGNDALVSGKEAGPMNSVDFELGCENKPKIDKTSRNGSDSGSGDERADEDRENMRPTSLCEPKVFNAGRKRSKHSIGPTLLDDESNLKNPDDHEYSHHIASEPDRESSGPNPIFFYLVLPSASEEEQELIPLEDLDFNLGIELKQSSLASDDPRVLETQSMCFDCGANRPLAISMPCAHGGLCLRCNIKHASKFKQCLYCPKVGFELRRLLSLSSNSARAHSRINLRIQKQVINSDCSKSSRLSEW